MDGDTVRVWRGGRELTIMRPSIRRSVCSYNQICTFCRLCKNRKIKFCSDTCQVSTDALSATNSTHTFDLRYALVEERRRSQTLTMGWVIIRFTAWGAMAAAFADQLVHEGNCVSALLECTTLAFAGQRWEDKACYRRD